MSQNINKSTKKTQTKGDSAMGTQEDIDTIEVHSNSEDSVVEIPVIEIRSDSEDSIIEVHSDSAESIIEIHSESEDSIIEIDSGSEASVIEIDSGSEASVIELPPKPSMKVTIKKGHNVQRGHFSQLKVGNPGVAVPYVNIERVNHTNRKEADRLWWEQTDAWAARCEGPDVDDEGDTDWASVHLPKTHLEKRDALGKRKKLEEEAPEEETTKGPKTKKRKM